MIHCYQFDGLNIVLDCYSGSIHMVDKVAYDMIQWYENEPAEEVIEKAIAKHGISRDDAEECIADIDDLKTAGKLYAPDKYEHLAKDFRKKKILLVVFAVMAISVWAHEETTSKPRPVPAPGNELSAEEKDATWTPLSVLGVPWNCDMTAGVDLFSHVKSVYGFQVNLLRGAREAYGGQIGVFRNFAYELYGFQVGAINHMEGGCGLQLGALNFHNDDGNSVQFGFINAPFMRSNNGSGIQIGAWNFSEGGSRLQLGALNLAKDSACVQIGCVNSAWDGHLNSSSRKSCIQIGFLNFRNGNEFSPVIGWSF